MHSSVTLDRIICTNVLLILLVCAFRIQVECGGNCGGKILTGPQVIKRFSCSTQLSMKFVQLINVKMPTIVGILTLRSRKYGNSGLSELEKGLFFIFYTYYRLKFNAQLI